MQGCNNLNTVFVAWTIILSIDNVIQLEDSVRYSMESDIGEAAAYEAATVEEWDMRCEVKCNVRVQFRLRKC